MFLLQAVGSTSQGHRASRRPTLQQTYQPTNNAMKKFVSIIFMVICSALAANAQTYLEHLQQSRQGLGKVSVTQSKAIDELVNGSNQVSGQKASTTVRTIKPENNNSPKTNNDTKEKVSEQSKTQEKTVARDNDNEAREKAREALKAKEKDAERRNEPHNSTETRKSADDNEMEIPTIDMRKKVMRNSYKVTGYRVQAFAGGNTRNDKQKAQQIGNAIKMRYPDQPIYVHFYSPRWICRVGNYRSYEEARRMLNNVKAMGYHAATIVKGKITVND